MLYVSQILRIILLAWRNNLNTVLKTIAIGISLSLTLPVLVQAASYTIDPSHSFVKFETSHLGISKLSGRFNKIVGKLMFDPAAGDGSQSVEVSIDTIALIQIGLIAISICAVAISSTLRNLQTLPSKAPNLVVTLPVEL